MLTGIERVIQPSDSSYRRRTLHLEKIPDARSPCLKQSTGKYTCMAHFKGRALSTPLKAAPDHRETQVYKAECYLKIDSCSIWTFMAAFTLFTGARYACQCSNVIYTVSGKKRGQ